MLKLGLSLILIASSAFAEMGFYAKTSLVVPAPVREKISSIFRVEIPSYLTLDIEQAKSFLSADHLLDDGRAIIKACIDRQEKTCTFPILKLQGTAFIDQKDTLLWTNCHLIDGWIRYQKQNLKWSGSNKKLYDHLKNQNLPIELYSHTNQRVSRRSDQFILKIASVIDANNTEDTGCDLRNDAIQFKSHRALGRGIPWSKAEPEDSANLKTFLGGYPLPATRHFKIKKPGVTSANQLFHWTRGELKTKSQFKDMLTALQKNPEHYTMVLSGPYAISVTNDGAEGMSGSPILNDKGEVLGIFRGILPTNDTPEAQNDYPLMSLGITVHGLNFIRYLTE